MQEQLAFAKAVHFDATTLNGDRLTLQAGDKVTGSRTSGQHQTGRLASKHETGVPAARPHTYPQPGANTESAQSTEIRQSTPIIPGWAHDVHNLAAAKRNDCLLGKPMHLKRTQTQTVVTVVHPQDFGLAASARIEVMHMPEIAAGTVSYTHLTLPTKRIV